MADDPTPPPPPAQIQPEPYLPDKDQEDQEESSGTSSSNEGSSGYFSRMFHRTIGGDNLERRIELIDKEEEELESRMVVRERTAEQVNRSMIFLSVNLEFVAGIYAYLRIRSRSLSWRARVLRILPMFLIPAVASFFYTFFSRFTSMLNLRDSRLLERIRKEREVKIRELKERANYYMTKRHIQNSHGESSSMASSLGPNISEISHTRDTTANPSLSWGERKQLQLERNTCHDAHNPTVTGENRKKKLRNLLICSTCRMHIGFASRDELPSISYKCPHCNALNGPHKEQRSCDSASTSADQPYNPFSIPEMPRGIFIEEITPTHVTTDPEMDASVIIIRESPIIGGREELPSNFTPDTSTPERVRKLPIGLSIEEMALNEETVNAEMEPPVMIIPELPATVNPLSVPEMETGLSVEEINPNDQQMEDHQTISPIVFVQDSPSADSQVELLSDRNSATAAPVTVPEFPRGLSIEEVSPSYQLTKVWEMDPPAMFVQVSPSLGVQELSESTPDSDARTSVTVPEMPGVLVEELNPNQPGNEDCEVAHPVMIVDDSPKRGGPAAVTPIEVPELQDDTINTGGSVRSPNDSASWSTPGSTATTEYSGTFHEVPEQGQGERNENEMPGSSRNENLQSHLNENADVHGPVKTTTVTAQASLIEPHLQSENGSVTDDGIDGDYESDSNSWGPFVSGPGATSTFTATTVPGIDEKSPSRSRQMDVTKINITHPDTNAHSSYSESEANSDYGSFTDVNEEDGTLDMETRAAVSENSDRVMEQNSRYPEGDGELVPSTYDDSMDTNGDFGSSSWNSGVTGSSTVSGDEGQGSDWEQYKELSGPATGERISDGLNLTTTGSTPVEETQHIVEEMPPTDTGDAVEEPEEVQQEGPRSSVSENSDSAEESRGHDDPNVVGSVAYDRDKGSTSQTLRKGVGGMKKDRIIEKKNRREEERLEEISDKEDSLKKQGTKPKPITMASAALLSPNSGLDHQSRPFTGIVSDPAPQWSTDTDFEPKLAVGLRHRR